MKNNLLVAALSFASAVGALAAPVTFQVDMSYQASIGAFDATTDRVEARGSFNNNWGPGFSLAPTQANPLLYTGVFDVQGAAGANYEYKFVKVTGTTDSWETSNNRPFTLTGSAQTLPVSYFNNQWDGFPLNVTFQVNMASQMAVGNFNPDNGDVIQVRGEFNNWSAGSVLAPSETNPDIYTGTFEVPQAPGSAVQYKFHIARVGEPEIWENDPNRRFTQSTTEQSLPAIYFNNVSGVPIQGALAVTVDMNAQITAGRFDPATQEVYVRGNKFGWGNPPEGVQLMADTTRSGIYTNTITRSVITGESVEFKFTIWDPSTSATTWEDGANKTVTFTGSESQNAAGAFVRTFGPHYFNDVRPEDVLAADTVVTFRVDMNGARRTTGEAFDFAAESVFINGTFVNNGWGPWGTMNPDLQMFDDGVTGGDTIANDRIYSFQRTFLKGSATRIAYKYGINSEDNEAAAGNDHIRYIKATGTYLMPVDKFGTPTQETLSLGNLNIARNSNGRIVLSWAAAPGVRLQKIADLNNLAGAVDVPNTEGQSSVELTADGQMGFFRLVRP